VELSNSFTVDVPVERAWEILTDVPTIAPCLPGAQLQEVEGEEYRGVVKVKVGPITAQYKGTATFVERDEANHQVVLRAEGRETRGQGNASATITAAMQPRGGTTEVVVTTDLTVTGKVAQFGRGVMADVSAKLMDQFAANLATTVLGGDEAVAAASGAAEPALSVVPSAPASGSTASSGDGASPHGDDTGATPPVVRRLDLPEAEPVDLLGTAGTPLLKRILPPLVAALLVVLVIRVLRHRGRA
jgi:uncharacterized protein